MKLKFHGVCSLNAASCQVEDDNIAEFVCVEVSAGVGSRVYFLTVCLLFSI